MRSVIFDRDFNQIEYCCGRFGCNLYFKLNNKLHNKDRI